MTHPTTGTLARLLGAVRRLRTEQLATWRGWPLTGAVLVDTPDPKRTRTALGVGPSAALLAYCVASSTLVTT